MRRGLLLALVLIPLAAAAQPRQVEDAHYGETLFHYYQGDYFTAITHLMTAQYRARVARDADEAELLLGSLKLSYGLTDAAEAIFQRLLAREGVSGAVRDRAWYYLARLAFQKGRLDQATYALQQIGREVPPELRGEQQMLSALVLMQQGDYANAAKVIQPWQGKPEREPYARYNLGIALVRSDRRAEGVKVLRELGELRTDEPDLVALKDKANMAIAQALIEAEPEEAKAALGRVRLAGPMSNRALLGVGWADIAAGDYRRALRPWQELTQRPVSDPAVQEAWVALPYVMSRLQARDQAADLYRTAVGALSGEAREIDAAMSAVRQGKLLEAVLKTDPRGNELPPVAELPGRAYLGQLLASHGFRRSLQDYQDIRALRANLEFWSGELDRYGQMLDANRARYQARAPRLKQNLAALKLDELTARRQALANRPLPPEQLAELDSALAELAERRLALDAADEKARDTLVAMGGRIQLMRDRIAALQPRLDAALDRYRQLLDQHALQALGARRDTLRAQVAQARFALAQLHDPAAASSEKTP